MWHLVCGINSAFLLFIWLTIFWFTSIKIKVPVSHIYCFVPDWLLLAVPSTKPIELPKRVQSQECKVEWVTASLNVSHRLCVRGNLLNNFISTFILCFFLRRHEWTSIYPKGAGLPPTALSRMSSLFLLPSRLLFLPSGMTPFPWDFLRGFWLSHKPQHMFSHTRTFSLQQGLCSKGWVAWWVAITSSTKLPDSEDGHSKQSSPINESIKKWMDEYCNYWQTF